VKQALLPEWFRVRDAADYSGISQTELFRLCLAGEIQSVHKLKPGQAKGIRLINRPSLDAYVRSFLPDGLRYRAPMAVTNVTGTKSKKRPNTQQTSLAESKSNA
jgi:hypothetical protein